MLPHKNGVFSGPLAAVKAILDDSDPKNKLFPSGISKKVYTVSVRQ